MSTAPPWLADNGDGTYRNPVLDADWSDPDVCSPSLRRAGPAGTAEFRRFRVGPPATTEHPPAPTPPRDAVGRAPA